MNLPLDLQRRAATPENLAAAGVNVHHVFGAGAYVKAVTMPAGSFLGQHSHTHDHQSVLVAGAVRIVVDGAATEHQGFTVLTIKAHAEHVIEALADSLWLCTWETDCTDPDTVDAAVMKE